MSDILDLKNKPSKESETEQESVLKKVDEKIFKSPTDKGPVPVMVSWLGPLYHNSPDPGFLTISLAVLYGVGVLFIFFQRNIFASIFFFLGATMLWLNSRRTSPEVEYVVGPLSLKIGNKEYQFSEIKSYWVDYNPGGIKELSLHLKKWYMPYIRIPLIDQDPVQISTILLKFVPEVEHQESAVDNLSRLLGI